MISLPETGRKRITGANLFKNTLIMAFKKVIPTKQGVYFIALTCARGLPLFAIADSYRFIYRWFIRLKHQQNHIVGFTILPDKLYALIAFTHINENITCMINDGKQRIAYEIIRSLRQKKAIEVLQRTLNNKKETAKTKHTLTEVFKRSFQCIECTTQHRVKQKLDFMHNSPCKNVPKLARHPGFYEHSSAAYYLDEQSKAAYLLTSFMRLADIGLTLL